MKVYVETNPETIYSGRVKDEVKTTEIRMWFETDEEIEVLSLADYTKQVRKEVLGELMNMLGDRAELIQTAKNESTFMFDTYDLSMCVEEILGEEVKENEK